MGAKRGKQGIWKDEAEKARNVVLQLCKRKAETVDRRKGQKERDGVVDLRSGQITYLCFFFCCRFWHNYITPLTPPPLPPPNTKKQRGNVVDQKSGQLAFSFVFLLAFGLFHAAHNATIAHPLLSADVLAAPVVCLFAQGQGRGAAAAARPVRLFVRGSRAGPALVPF